MMYIKCVEKSRDIYLQAGQSNMRIMISVIVKNAHEFSALSSAQQTLTLTVYVNAGHVIVPQEVLWSIWGSRQIL